jgi:nucleotide-binding universal stress UspA family protein
MTLSLRRILVPTDLSDFSLQALPVAVELATRFDADLLLVHVIEPPLWATDVGGIPVSVPAYEGEHKKRAEQKLQQVARSLAPARARVLLREGHPLTQIVTTAGDERADLIVVSTHGRSGLAHALLGSVAERIVRHAPCPVLTVRCLPPAKAKQP